MVRLRPYVRICYVCGGRVGFGFSYACTVGVLCVVFGVVAWVFGTTSEVDWVGSSAFRTIGWSFFALCALFVVVISSTEVASWVLFAMGLAVAVCLAIEALLRCGICSDLSFSGNWTKTIE